MSKQIQSERRNPALERRQGQSTSGQGTQHQRRRRVDTRVTEPKKTSPTSTASQPALPVTPTTTQTPAEAATIASLRKMPLSLDHSKVLTWYGMIAGGCIAAVFAIDLVIGLPFYRASLLMDVTFLGCGAWLAYSSWETLKKLP